MTFVSFSFVIFLPTVVILYYLIPKRVRWALLLLASCYFYMAFIPAYLLVLFALIIIDYAMAIRIEHSQGARRKYFLWVSIASMLVILFIFKYFNFFNANLEALTQFLHWNYSFSGLQLLLPLGLSFHTFQSLSYVIEVYRGRYKAEKHFGIYALYVMFFPQLVAGPIERPAHLLPQLHNTTHIRFSFTNIISGLRLMGWGFFKKVVVADRLALTVDYVWKNMAHLPGESIVGAIVFFAFQLYADFSGYSDIARGSSRMLGLEIVQNFHQPYFSRSVAEFWRRWHISLSTWFRDYVFTPLALKWRNVYLATLFTFVLIGFWHGANWTFIAMGFLFGVYITLGLLTKRRPKMPALLQQLFTFSLIAIAWTFFRAPNISEALFFLRRLLSDWSLSFEGFIHTVRYPFELFGISFSEFLLGIGGIAVLLIIEYFEQKGPLTFWFIRQPLWVRSFIYSGMAFSIALFGVLTTNQFIYFQF